MKKVTRFFKNKQRLLMLRFKGFNPRNSNGQKYVFFPENITKKVHFFKDGIDQNITIIKGRDFGWFTYDFSVTGRIATIVKDSHIVGGLPSDESLDFVYASFKSEVSRQKRKEPNASYVFFTVFESYLIPTWKVSNGTEWFKFGCTNFQVNREGFNFKSKIIPI